MTLGYTDGQSCYYQIEPATMTHSEMAGVVNNTSHLSLRLSSFSPLLPLQVWSIVGTLAVPRGPRLPAKVCPHALPRALPVRAQEYAVRKLWLRILTSSHLSLSLLLAIFFLWAWHFAQIWPTVICQVLRQSCCRTAVCHTHDMIYLHADTWISNVMQTNVFILDHLICTSWKSYNTITAPHPKSFPFHRAVSVYCSVRDDVRDSISQSLKPSKIWYLFASKLSFSPREVLFCFVFSGSLVDDLVIAKHSWGIRRFTCGSSGLYTCMFFSELRVVWSNHRCTNQNLLVRPTLRKSMLSVTLD